jgi:soluble lytic murein transglycosylase-like protein
MFDEAARRFGLPASLIAAVAWQESRLHRDAVSPKGALGLMQLMPETARALGVEARDPRANVQGGASYLRAMLDRYHGSLPSRSPPTTAARRS